MHLICLCPTYGRPSLVANALALFQSQKLRPGDTARLLIFDDAGQIEPQSTGYRGKFLTVESQDEWIPLAEKYGRMLESPHCAPHLGDRNSAFVVWDDDDVYLPWHLAAHALALEFAAHFKPPLRWSHPSRAWSTYGINPLREPPRVRHLNGRHYHGELAVRGDLLKELGGWPKTDRSDYDKQMLAACWRLAGPPADPCNHANPSYVYRWQDTGHDHCSARIRDGKYRQPRIQEPGRVEVLKPGFDASTMAILEWAHSLRNVATSNSATA